VGLDLVEAALQLPSVVVSLGELDGACLVRIEDRCDEPVDLGLFGAAASNLVLDDAHRVTGDFDRITYVLGDLVSALGRKTRVDEHRQVRAVRQLLDHHQIGDFAYPPQQISARGGRLAPHVVADEAAIGDD
jgi:hypothetical protein